MKYLENLFRSKVASLIPMESMATSSAPKDSMENRGCAISPTDGYSGHPGYEKSIEDEDAQTRMMRNITMTCMLMKLMCW